MAINVRLQLEEEALLEDLARRSGRSKNEVIRIALVEKAAREACRERVDASPRLGTRPVRRCREAPGRGVSEVVLLSGEDLHRIADRLGLIVRDAGLLAAAAGRPAATVFGDDAYPSLHQKAAAVMDSIVRSHPLVDGNKRLGWLSLVLTLDLNGVRLEAPDDEAVELTLTVAAGQSGMDDVVAAVERWTTAERVA